ncbi:prephenate dehydrogenase [Kineothrix sp. MB12-C1]|uniref:prephenate dehydrogenase n=1 Tax=Kineothrix sp. MB12-C1 TaxID=3070215 RepID=UPI0027D2ACE5|nr:prephenate dehydrogenase [Kineothrix sp. MB12-C1]WMC92440.1 prephenate dehydrogenase [Kineothrix sp. MB12-C1]
MKHLTLGFIGLGLIGGSIAKALKASGLNTTIIAYDLNGDSLTQAQADGVVDVTCSFIDASFSKCDYIFLCAPVSKNDENLTMLKQFLSPSCTLTDVGSVKSGIHRHVEELGLTAQFIGGHPMTGSERFGYSNSKPILLENAYYILTPSGCVSNERVEEYRSLVLSMGAIPLVLDAKKHDYVTAAISHLPHITASSLVNLVRDSDSEDGIMKMIAAGGFKDITRIASSSPDMWQQICLTNTENIVSLLDDYIKALSCIKEQLIREDADFLYEFFDSARVYRDSFIETSSGPIKKSYSITIDIADEAGALASIATMLALNNISIKNIGIVHNRELAEGVLRIEFYGESAVNTAIPLLTNRGYTIYEKK